MTSIGCAIMTFNVHILLLCGVYVVSDIWDPMKNDEDLIATMYSTWVRYVDVYRKARDYDS